MIFAGISLASLAALELALREHFSGYRSHSSVLAGFVAVLVLGLGFVLAWPQVVKVGAGAGGVRGLLLPLQGGVQAAFGRARLPVSERLQRLLIAARARRCWS